MVGIWPLATISGIKQLFLNISIILSVKGYILLKLQVQYQVKSSDIGVGWEE